ncbi:hypothetical protein BDQ17DRAFT_1434081 [Cyathus striatus]|nr:hypothetical protein BDQ17DRAFT_1434081 [Cyathus striatus]
MNRTLPPVSSNASSGTNPKGNNGARVAYKATVFQDSNFTEKVEVDGEIHNNSGPGQLSRLLDMLEAGKINQTQFNDLYDKSLQSEGRSISEITSEVGKGAKGKIFTSKGIFNETVVRSGKQASK